MLTQETFNQFFKRTVFTIACLFLLFISGNAQTGRIITVDCPTVTDAGPDKTICPSPGSVPIGTTPITGINYSWSPTTGLSNSNIANPIASPTATTTYTLTTTGRNVIYNGDFELGNSGVGSDYTYQAPNIFLGGNGNYTIASNPHDYVGPWCNTLNHTPSGNNMLIVDGLQDYQANNNFWSQTVTLQSNTDYLLSAWFYSLGSLNISPYWPIIQIKVNGNIVVNNYILPYTNCAGWVNLKIPINIGNLSTALIEMKSVTFSGYNGGNDFAVDDISLACMSKDDMLVTVCQPCLTPTISPKGPIEYNTHYEWAVAAASSVPPDGRYFLTSSSPNNNQWYVDGNPISGINNLGIGYRLNPLDVLPHWDENIHEFRVKNTLCNLFSAPVYFHLKKYGDIVPLSNPMSYCENTNGKMINFNLGAGTKYTWDAGFNTAQNYFTVTPIANTNSAAISIGTLPANYNGYAYVYVVNTADLNGEQKVIDYVFTLRPGAPSVSVGNWCNPNIYANSNGAPYTLPGATKFDWEDYEFGPNATLLNYQQYVISTSPLTVRVPHSIQTSPIKAKLTGNSYILRHFFNSNNLGECYSEKVIINIPYPCFAKESTDLTPVIYPNPATSQVTITSRESTIESIEIYDVLGVPFKKINGNNSKSISLNVSTLKAGVYNCKIVTANGIEYQKLMVQH